MKSLLILSCILLINCNKTENKKIETSGKDTIATISEKPVIDSIKPEIIKTEFVLNTFSELPEQYFNESEANAYLFTNITQVPGTKGEKYGVCDLINNVAIIKINGKFEKLKNISSPDTYFKNKKYENADYKLELNLNQTVPKKTETEILTKYGLDGAFVLQGSFKLTDLKNKQELTKDTFLLGVN